MARGSVRTVGLEELIVDLRNYPKEIQQNGMDIMREEVEAAAEEIRRNYPEESFRSERVARGEKTGVLRKGVKTEYPSSTLVIGKVISTAPHSHLYEFGTQVRHTSRGAHRGSVGPHPVTVPIARRHRRQMYERIKQMLKDKGFEVTGG
jgi:hypothetical protein